MFILCDIEELGKFRKYIWKVILKEFQDGQIWIRKCYKYFSLVVNMF